MLTYYFISVSCYVIYFFTRYTCIAQFHYQEKEISETNLNTQVLDVYDCGLGLLRIGPFNYDPLRGVDLWLSQSDQFILQHLSTSPEVELPHFVSQVLFIILLLVTIVLLKLNY